MRRIDAFVIDLQYHALLVFRRQQRQYGRHLVGAPVIPNAAAVRNILAVCPVPLRHRFVGVLRRSASRLRVGEQRLVVLLRRLERIRTHEVLARPIHVAVSPARRYRRIAPDSRIGRGLAGAAAAHIGNLSRRVAAVVSFIQPERFVLVEIFGREHVERQRLHAIGRLAVPCRPFAVTPHIGRWIHRWKWRSPQALELLRTPVILFPLLTWGVYTRAASVG